MEQYIFQGVISLAVGLIILYMKQMRSDVKDLDKRLREAPSREEVREEIRIQQEPIRVLQQEIKEDVKEMRADIKKLIENR